MTPKERDMAVVMLGKRQDRSSGEEGGPRKEPRVGEKGIRSSGSSMDTSSGQDKKEKRKEEGKRSLAEPKIRINEVGNRDGKGKEPGEDKRPGFRVRAPIQQGGSDPMKAVMEAVKGAMVPIRLSDLLAIPTFQREMRREVTTRRVYGVNTVDYLEEDSEGLADDEEPLVRLFGEVRSVGQTTKGEDPAASQRQGMTHAHVTEKGSEEDEIRRGQRNDPAKWRTRPLLTRSPYIRDVEVCSLDGGFYVAMVPNDDGSQMNLISTSLAKAVEGRGVTVDWDYEFSMRTANGQVEDLKGLVPALPVFIRGVRFEIAALVVGDSAPFALLWGSPANTGANSKT
ncbi:hypothetical protein HDU67_005752, partial [Dinochytrium kinnereticum]